MDQVHCSSLCRPNEESLMRAMQELRQNADGCRLQGGEEQLEKALTLFGSYSAILNGRELCQYKEQGWHKMETRHCQLGLGLTFAGLQNFEKAESAILKAMNESGLAHERELLVMVTSLVSDVYLAAAAQETLAAPRGSWLLRGWNILRWGLTRVCAPVSSSIQSSCLDLQNTSPSVPSDRDVHEVYSLLYSDAFLQRCTEETAGDEDIIMDWRKQLQTALALLNQLLTRLSLRSLAATQCAQLLDNLPSRDLPIFQPVCLEGLRCVLGYCQSLRDAKAAVPADLLDLAQRHAQQELRRGARAAYELWGDLLRIRGQPQDASLALCLYAACFGSHAGDAEARRLAEKLQALAAQTLGAVSSLRLTDIDAACEQFLRAREILCGQPAALDASALTAAVAQSKAFLDGLRSDEERRRRLLPRTRGSREDFAHRDALAAWMQKTKAAQDEEDALRCAEQIEHYAQKMRNDDFIPTLAREHFFNQARESLTQRTQQLQQRTARFVAAFEEAFLGSSSTAAAAAAANTAEAGGGACCQWKDEELVSLRRQLEEKERTIAALQERLTEGYVHRDALAACLQTTKTALDAADAQSCAAKIEQMRREMHGQNHNSGCREIKIALAQQKLSQSCQEMQQRTLHIISSVQEALLGPSSASSSSAREKFEQGQKTDEVLALLRKIAELTTTLEDKERRLAAVPSQYVTKDAMAAWLERKVKEINEGYRHNYTQRLAEIRAHCDEECLETNEGLALDFLETEQRCTTRLADEIMKEFPRIVAMVRTN